MIVDQFSSYSYGGAGGAAIRHHQLLRKARIDSRFFCWDQDPKNVDSVDDSVQIARLENEPKQHWLGPFNRKIERLRRRTICQLYETHLRDRDETLEVFSQPGLLDPTAIDPTQVHGDIVQLHWISFFLDYQSFFKSLRDDKPIVWTLHDMNPLTGGCHYSGKCERFRSGCGNCPQVNLSSPTDVSAAGFKTKRRALRDKNLTIVAPSQWLLSLAEQSPVFGEDTRFEMIRYGFDLETFHPIDKRVAKKQLGIDPDQTVISFGAENITTHRKGMHHLLNSLPQLNCREPVEFLTFGNGTIEGFQSSYKIHHAGYVDDPKLQATIYSASDVFVMPSLEDNSPQTGLEAMACGTPVVAFKTGGVPEYVIAGETGMLAPVGDETALANVISWLVDHPNARTYMNKKVRELMELQYDGTLQTQRYIDLYYRLLNAKTAQRMSKAA